MGRGRVKARRGLAGMVKIQFCGQITGKNIEELSV